MAPLLPVEIYTKILTQLPGREPSSTTAVVSFLYANSVTRAGALDQAVWHRLYAARYIRSIRNKEIERSAKLGDDWRLMYIERYKLDRTALTLLKHIRTHPDDSRASASRLARELSFDVWDAIELESQLPIPYVFRDEASEPEDEYKPAVNALPRRFWARAALGALSRLQAVVAWGRTNYDEDQCSFEDILIGFSAFTDVSSFEILNSIDELTARCRSRLFTENLQLEVGTTGYDLPRLLIAIRKFLNDEGFSIGGGRMFYFAFNQFPHYFLAEGRSHTIPMSINFVFCAICNRLGIQAAPTNTPRKILCHITSPDPEAGNILFDPCAQGDPVVFSSTEIPSMLVEVGMHPGLPADAVTPATPRSILTRVINNIFATMQEEQAVQHEDPSGFGMARVHYAVSTAFATAHAPIIHIVPRVPENCPLDPQMVLLDGLLPLLPEERRERFKRDLESDLTSSPTYLIHPPRTRPVVENGREIEVELFVGQVVKVVEGNELACIIGWQIVSVPILEDGEVRVAAYIVAAKSSMQHCIGKQIRPAQLSKTELLWIRQHTYQFDRFFEDAYIPRPDGFGGRLIPTAELQQQYPDDMELAKRWSEEQVKLRG